MLRRHLGTHGPEVSAIGLGCMGMSMGYGPRDDTESAKTLHRALDLGITLFDTADMYGMGHNEELIGATLRDRRADFFLATKFGVRSRTGGQVVTGDSTMFVDTSPEYVRAACDASLSRLGFDTIDLYYAHRRNPQVPIEDTVGAMAELVQAGKIRYLGLSEVNAATLRAAHAVHPITALQMEYSLFTRDVESELFATCKELGIGLVAYSPMGRGILTGTVTDVSTLAADDVRRVFPRFTGDNLEANLRLVDSVRSMAKDLGLTPAQTALAWLLAKDEIIVPIPGTKRVHYVEENVAAVDVRLTAEQVAALDAAVPPGVVAGTRYGASGMQTIGH